MPELGERNQLFFFLSQSQISYKSYRNQGIIMSQALSCAFHTQGLIQSWPDSYKKIEA